MTVELSVVIPTRNRATRLAGCLDALRAQTQSPDDFEVIVVDDGSTDETRSLLAASVTSFALRVITQAWQGQAAALNRGLEAAAGTYCLFLDDDIEVEPEFVAAHLDAQRTSGGVIGIGRLGLSISSPLDWLSRCHAEAWLSRYRRLDEGAREVSFRDCSSGNLSVPRAALAEAGGFAADLARSFDVELAYRLECQGLSYRYIPAAFGRQYYVKRLPDVVRDAKGAGAAAVELHRRQPALLPHLELGGRGDVGAVARSVCTMLVRSHVPPSVVAAPGRLLGDRAVQRWWYRLVFAHAYWRGVRGALSSHEEWEAYAGGVRILMYHAVDARDRSRTAEIVPVAQLSRQMAWLERRGYRVMSLRQFLEERASHRVLPGRSLVLTFDDGYEDVASDVQPVLERHGFPATVFLVTAQMGSRMSWDPGSVLHRRALLTWDDARRLAETGLDFGAHTRTHARLTTLSAKLRDEELGGSLADLERELPSPIPVLAYPYGSYDGGTAAAARRSGFQAALTARSGINVPATPPFELRRISVRGTDSLLRFAVNVSLGRRWEMPRGAVLSGARVLLRSLQREKAAA